MLYLVMGVSGVGKTTISIELSSILDATFLDSDDFHSKANIIKMNDGISLTDEDRKPWLLKLNCELKKTIASNKSIILACSALKGRESCSTQTQGRPRTPNERDESSFPRGP